MIALPSEHVEAISQQNKCDNFYAVPSLIVDFISRLNAELPKGYKAKPWTLMRSVSVFNEKDEPIYFFCYEFIEDAPDSAILYALRHLNQRGAR